MADNIRLLIVDDISSTLDNLKKLLSFEDDIEESRKTIPPVGAFDLPAPGPDATLPHAQRARPYLEPASATRATQGAVPGSQGAASHGSGPRPVAAQLHAPQPIIRQQPASPQYPNFGDDDPDERTSYGVPSFGETQDPTRSTLEYQGDPYELAAQLYPPGATTTDPRMRGLEPLPPDTTDGHRLAPEELLTTKAHAPSGELLAKARREREAAARNASDEAPTRDTIPPESEYNDSTVVGGLPQPPVRPSEWEDDTTPIGGDKASQRRR